MTQEIKHEDLTQVFFIDIGNYFIQVLKDKLGKYYINVEGEIKSVHTDAEKAMSRLAEMYVKERVHSFNLFLRVEKMLNDWDRDSED